MPQNDKHGAAQNTDRELWREREGDYYADSIHVTEGGGIGIDSGGMVYVRPIREWHRLAQAALSAEPRSIAVLRGVSNLLRRCLRHGLLRAETEAMLLDIEAALTVAPTSADSPTNAAPQGNKAGAASSGAGFKAADSDAGFHAADSLSRGLPNNPAAAAPVSSERASILEQAAQLFDAKASAEQASAAQYDDWGQPEHSGRHRLKAGELRGFAAEVRALKGAANSASRATNAGSPHEPEGKK